MKIPLVFLLGLIGLFFLLAHFGKRLEEYAIEHNCIYDTNGLCYTQEERPWLFK